ncbi:MAG: ATP-binding protein, partial [Thalassobaculaceae bacterium]
AGLAGIAAPATFRGVRLCRPLLEETRAATEATCRAFGQAWLDDPSNQDSRFQRVRDRRLLAGDDWPTADHLVRVGRAMAAARREVDHQVRQFLARHGVWHDGGWLTMARAAWVDLPETLALSVLSQAIQAVGGGDYPPAGTGLARVADMIAGTDRTLTLGGCRIICRGAGVVICREWHLMTRLIDPSAGRWHRWDNRFELWVPPGLGQVGCAPLGEDGWRALSAAPGSALRVALAPVPWPARLAFPVLRHLDDGRLVHQVRRAWERPGFDPHMAALVFAPNGSILDARRH